MAVIRQVVAAYPLASSASIPASFPFRACSREAVSSFFVSTFRRRCNQVLVRLLPDQLSAVIAEPDQNLLPVDEGRAKAFGPGLILSHAGHDRFRGRARRLLTAER